MVEASAAASAEPPTVPMVEEPPVAPKPLFTPSEKLDLTAAEARRSGDAAAFPAALPAALYFEAIALQSPDKAWQFYDAVFANARQLVDGEDFLKAMAVSVGADMTRLEKDARSPEIYKKIAADKQEFEQAKYDGVPVFIINGKVLVGAQPPQKFIEAIDAALKK